MRSVSLSFHLIAFVAFVVTASSRAGEKDKATPSTTMTNPQIRLIGYCSSKVTSAPARSQHALAKRAFDRAQLSVTEGGLGMLAGFRDVEDPDSWKDFVSRCKEGEVEAQSYLPLIRRGTVVFFIADAETRVWSYGPAVLNDTMDEFIQISFTKDEHKRLHPQRYLIAVTGNPK